VKAAVHEQVDDPLGLGRVVRHLGGHGIIDGVGGLSLRQVAIVEQQVAQSHRADTHAAIAQKLTTSGVGGGVGMSRVHGLFAVDYLTLVDRNGLVIIITVVGQRVIIV